MKDRRAMGEAGQSGRRRGDALYFAAACAVALFLAAATILLNRFSFATADEAWMALALSGSFTKQPAAWVPYLSPVLTRAFALLYGRAPGTPWYVLFHIGAIVFGMIVVNACVFSRVRKHFPRRALVPGALFCLLADMPLCWTLSRLTLYHVAAVTGAAALCLALEKQRGRSFVGAGVLAAILTLIAVSCAPVMGAGVIFGIVAITLYHRLGLKDSSRGKKTVVRGVCLALVALALLAGTLVLSRSEQSRLCGDDYAGWDALHDTFVGSAPGAYDDDESAYRRAGWSRELSELAGRIYLMDEQFNAKAVSGLLGRDSFASSTSWNDLVRAAGAQVEPNLSKGMVLGLAVLIHAVCLVCVLLGQRKSAKAQRAGLPVCCVILADVLFVWFLRKGSLNYESAFAVAAPCLLIALLCMTDIACGFIRGLHAEEADAEGGQIDVAPWLFAAVSAVVLVGSLGICVLNGRALCAGALVGAGAATPAGGEYAVAFQFAEEDGEATALDEGEKPGLLKYLEDHPSKLFVCDEAVLANLNVVDSMRSNAPANLYCWSESQRYSWPFNGQQALNGLSEPLGSGDFEREDVFFISASPDNIRLLHRFLSQSCGLRACVVTDAVDGGAWVVKYQKQYDVDATIPAKTAPIGVSVCDREGEISEYAKVVSGKRKDATVQWLKRNELLVNYHLTADSEADEAKTRVEFGASTPTLTCAKLGFFRAGYRFLGWNVYRADTRSWLVRDANGGIQWTSEPLQEGDEYLRYPDGVTLSRAAEAGTVIDFYGVWKKTEIYTVNYHMDDDAEAARTEKVVPGESAVTLINARDLGFFRTGKQFVGWKVYRSDKQRWSVENAAGEQSWAKKAPKDGKFRLYEDGATVAGEFPAGTELHLYAQWEDTERFSVYYHSDRNTQSPLTTPVVYGVDTPSLSYRELDFYEPGHRFGGWRVYRPDTKSWLVVKKNGQTDWEEKPKDPQYALWQDGHSLSQAVPAGAELHLYAQWEDTDEFTVFYHLNDEATESAQTTRVTYGKPTRTLTPDKLGYFVGNKRFAGWRMYRNDIKCWGVVDAQGNSAWAKSVPEGGEYWLYQAGWSVSEAVPAGYELHFYAQWEDTDTYTILYYENDDAGACEATTAARANEPAATLTVEELGFDTARRRFMGWKLFRTDEKTWYITDAKGEDRWAASVPRGGRYCLRESGFTLENLDSAGAEVHLYAQWADFATVYYHMTDASPASEVVTRIVYGDTARIEPLKTLGFSRKDRAFTGWKAYRADNGSWLMEDDSDETAWLEVQQDGWRYCLLGNRAMLSAVQPGAEIHLYAQWE